MSPQARTGLLAFGIVVGLVGAPLVILVAVLAAGGKSTPENPASKIGSKVESYGVSPNLTGPERRPDPPAPKKDLTGPLSAGPKDDDAAYILGHRWWKVPPTRARLDEIARVIIEAQKGWAVLVSSDGKTTLVEPSMRSVGPLEQVYVGRFFDVGCDWPTRPDRTAVLRAMRAAIDRVEYRHGPGR